MDRVRRERRDAVDDADDDVGVGAREVEPRLPRLDAGAGGDDDDVGTARVVEAAGTEAVAAPERRRVVEVERLALGADVLDVDETISALGTAIAANSAAEPPTRPAPTMTIFGWRTGQRPMRAS